MKEKKATMIGDRRIKFQPISKSPTMKYINEIREAYQYHWLSMVDIRGYANGSELSSLNQTKYKYRLLNV